MMRYRLGKLTEAEDSPWYNPMQDDDHRRDIVGDVLCKDTAGEMLECAWSAVRQEPGRLRIEDCAGLLYSWVDYMQDRYDGRLELSEELLKQNGGYMAWDMVATIFIMALDTRSDRMQLLMQALDTLDVDFQQKCMDVVAVM